MERLVTAQSCTSDGIEDYERRCAVAESVEMAQGGLQELELSYKLLILHLGAACSLQAMADLEDELANCDEVATAHWDREG